MPLSSIRARGFVPAPAPRSRTRHTPPQRSAAAGAPRRPVSPRRSRNPFARLHPEDRHVLWLYAMTRAAVWTLAYCARWLFPADRDDRDPGSFLAPFQHWDWVHYLHIAQDGYFPGQAGPWRDGWDNREAFFPGFPFLLRAVHTVVPDWAVAGLLISFAAGAVAVVALARIARTRVPGTGSGRRAVLYLLLSPCAVFLAVGYTESLFLAFALPAWLAAQRHHWPLAAGLTSLAVTVRVSGLFLAAAVAVQFAVTAHRHRQWRAAPWLVLPALPAVLYSWYLQVHTGDWMAWKHAQERGWYRNFHAPWEAWSNTWHAAFGRTQTTGYAFMFQVELLAMLLGMLLLGLLVRRRCWPEAVYVGLSLWALGTSYWYTSLPRATLLWWPLWTGLAAWTVRRPRFEAAYLCLAAPLATVFALTYLTGRWTG
ncbi:mannosyltransferase family protein [Streptomyces sp. NPDC059175]|uniref:mannosyltransferase family protein n=1 Tax=unclassified Streptomyces TaxID=2593676 RepID=UPI00367D07CC